ncbi:hypothetical protein F511_47470 [Dorcoceras hygrometricum]|uniref:Uncharacterized protein n=1 Tax=Dorcoceras hygrometricum TaxID=472368 RepID=A0A2Z6ZQZ5_9LAMI|nr:hypothetical protein F511_47470 [Dorcoceras hygrometricum]
MPAVCATVGRKLLGGAALGAAACGHAPHAMLAAAVAAVRRISRKHCDGYFSSRLSSGQSRAAHEVFGPIFDVGSILVGPKLILKFLRFWA